MPDTWINRLIVSGPTWEVRRFESVVAVGEGPAATSLSFTQLQRHLPEDQRYGLDEPVEPWSDDNDTNPNAVSPPYPQTRAEPGMTDLSYDFTQARYEPDDLLIRASTLFPRLCFVFGWVAPNVDEAASRFIRNGHKLLYKASGRRRESLRAKAYRRRGLSLGAEAETPDDEDNLFWADVEGDWAQLDAVVRHWDGTVARALHRLQNAAPQTRPRRRARDQA
jgi:hypothetical protein